VDKHQILQLLPQTSPFRFVDEIIEVTDAFIIGSYRFREDEFFYKGHFQNKPITPGVILLEAMGQVGVVAHGIYLLTGELGLAEIPKYLSVFSDAIVEFYAPVFPGDKVIIRGEKVFWRQKKLRSKITMLRGDTLVASCTASGVGVKR
jgi:3-hydroxyacyl-[acyl-carrier-protein] dehydratase